VTFSIVVSLTVDESATTNLFVVLSRARFTAPLAKDLIAAGCERTLELLAMRSFAALRMTREVRLHAIKSHALRADAVLRSGRDDRAFYEM
jgi:hypothetical protein